ncbi:hypothetical protein [Altericroceibacterium endophyticum]|uniref:Uncharacterized protein n=1 Tax=Altericroceibacterium endophyticum TaxID=1808508 RepID=A0A6I4T3M9_9SPHN|nr:hypothetical protein [Altericroceibacterium endophyticum]MXO65884.1 hypothetical protein [Altericroceibacterium endophyticum]
MFEPHDEPPQLRTNAKWLWFVMIALLIALAIIWALDPEVEHNQNSAEHSVLAER